MKTASKSLVLKVVLSLVFAISMLAFAFTIKPAMADATIRMKDGASIRYGNDRPGIRFSSYVPDSYFTDGELNDGIEVGMLLVQSDKGTESDLVLDSANANVKKVSSNDNGFIWVSVKDAKIDIEGFERFNVVVTNIPQSAEAYGTEIIAKSYIKVDGQEPVYATNVVTRSIARVANQILAEDEGNDAITSEETPTLNGYVTATSRISAGNSAVSFRVEGDKLVWGRFANAIGYYVCVDGQSINVPDPQDSSTTCSINLSEFDNPVGEVTMSAYGDGTNYSRAWREYCAIVDMPGGVVNGVANGKNTSYSPNGENAANEEVRTEDATEGYNLTIANDRWCSSFFALSLAEGLDLTSHDGLVIKFKVNSYDGAESEMRFAPHSGSNYNAANDKVLVDIGSTEWQYLYLSNTALNKYCSAGDKIIQFILYTPTKNNTYTAKTVMNIGAVAYYDELSVPANLTITDGVASWDEVANADGYVVAFNGVDQEVVTETSMDLTTLIGALSSYSVKVKAVSNDFVIADSTYCTEIFEINEPANVLASYNNEIYTSMVSGLGLTNASATYVSSNADDGFGGHDGAVEVTLNNPSGFVDMFTVNLPKAVDFTNYPLGIIVRMRLVSAPEHTYRENSNYELFIGQADKDATAEYSVRKNSASYGTLAFSGEWAECLIPASALSAFVGQTKIYFGVGVVGGDSGPTVRGIDVVVQIDSINYASLEEPADTLASFKNSAYAGVISRVGENNTLQSATYLPANANDGFGGHDGAVEITLTKTGYGYVQGFQVALSKAIDVTTNTNGIKVRLRVVSAPVADDITELKVKLGELKQTDAREYSIREYAPEYGTATIGGDWVEITIPASALTVATNGFSEETPYNGTSVIAFAFCQAGTALRNTSDSTPTVIQIDYIKYA